MEKKVFVLSLFLVGIFVFLSSVVSVSAGQPSGHACYDGTGFSVYQKELPGCSNIDCSTCKTVTGNPCAGTPAPTYYDCKTSEWDCNLLNVGGIKPEDFECKTSGKYAEVRTGRYSSSTMLVPVSKTKGYYYYYQATNGCTDADYVERLDTNFKKCIEIVDGKEIYHGFLIGTKCSTDTEIVSVSDKEFGQTAHRANRCGGWCPPPHVFSCSPPGSPVTETGCQKDGEVCYAGWNDINKNGESEETSGFCYSGECISKCEISPAMEGKTCLTKEELQNPKTYCPIEGCECKACVDWDITSQGYAGQCTTNSPPKINEGCSSPCITVASDDNDIKKAWTDYKIFYKGLSNGFNINAEDTHSPNDEAGNPTRTETPKDQLVCELSEKNKITSELTSLAKNGCMPLPWNAGNYKDEDLPLDIKAVFNVLDDGTIVSNPEACKGEKESTSQEMDMKVCPSGEIDIGSFSILGIWAGEKHNENQNYAEVAKEPKAARFSIESRKMDFIINPDPNICGNPYIEIDIFIDTKGWKNFMNSIKKKLRKVGIDILNKLADKLPEKGTADLKFTIKPFKQGKNIFRAMIYGKINGEDVGTIVEEVYDRDKVFAIIQKIASSQDSEGECVYDDGKGNINTLKEKKKATEENGIKINKIYCWTPGAKDWQLKKIRKEYPDGRIEIISWKLFDSFWHGLRVTYDQYSWIKVDMDIYEILRKLQCCPELKEKTDKVRKELETTNNENSLYFLRDIGNFNYNGKAYVFSPEYTFNKYVTRRFNYSYLITPNLDINNLRIFIYQGNEANGILNNCTYNVTETAYYTVLNDGMNISFTGMKYEIPRGAVNSSVNLKIDLIDLSKCFCHDGTRDNNEDGVDCGGPCNLPCPPTCEDNIQNGEEEGIDCGGNCTDACPVSCQTDGDCNSFCSSYEDLYNMSICFEGMCFCTNCGDNICSNLERFIGVCDNDCIELTLYNVLFNIDKWKNGLISLKDIEEIINKWIQQT